MAMTEAEKEEFRRFLGITCEGIGKCEACAGTRWRVEGPYVLPGLDTLKTLDLGACLPLVALVCERCHLVRFHVWTRG